MPLQCSICLFAFREPVSLPCGHIYCKICLTDHVNVPTNKGMTSTCPECRKPFHLTVPDVTYLPEKYRPFIAHAIRRVYIDTAPTEAEADVALLTEKVAELSKQVVKLQGKLTRKAEIEAMLVRECESLSEDVTEHRDALKAEHERATEYVGKLQQLKEELKYQKERSKKKHLDMTSGLAVLQEQKQNYRDALNESLKENAQLTKKLTRSEEEKARMEVELHELRKAVAAAGLTDRAKSSSSAPKTASHSPEAGPSRNRVRASASASVPSSDNESISDTDDIAHLIAAFTPIRARTSASASGSGSSSGSGSGSGLRLIKPLPKRLRVTRAREDDSAVLSASAKRARVLRG